MALIVLWRVQMVETENVEEKRKGEFGEFGPYFNAHRD
jgi:hypothetical protein